MLWAHGRGSVRREVDHRELCPQLPSVRCTSSTSQLGTQLSWRRSLLTHAALYCCMCAVLAFELESLHNWCTPGLVCSVHDAHQSTIFSLRLCTAHNDRMLGVCADGKGAGPSACLLACGRLLHQSIVVPWSHETLQCNTAVQHCSTCLHSPANCTRQHCLPMLRDWSPPAAGLQPVSKRVPDSQAAQPSPACQNVSCLTGRLRQPGAASHRNMLRPSGAHFAQHLSSPPVGPQENSSWG